MVFFFLLEYKTFVSQTNNPFKDGYIFFYIISLKLFCFVLVGILVILGSNLTLASLGGISSVISSKWNATEEYSSQVSTRRVSFSLLSVCPLIVSSDVREATLVQTSLLFSILFNRDPLNFRGQPWSSPPKMNCIIQRRAEFFLSQTRRFVAFCPLLRSGVNEMDELRTRQILGSK